MRRLLLALLILPAPAAAQGVNTLPPELAEKVRAAVQSVVDRTHVPSASVGVVRNGRIVYTQAFGMARLDPALPATADQRYAIGSISKQFTAACVLLLVQEGKMSLDDPVSKWFPELTRARDVKVRNLLTHTSGYQDYAPQDYTIPAWTHQTNANAIIHEWATKPLDFDPGTQYQYSNTNFNIVGLIIEKVSGQPFWTFLSSRILRPLGMDRTLDLDTQHDETEVTGYMRNALGPLRPAIPEAPGWYFADGGMAMPTRDLLTWDISLMNETVLTHASYVTMESEFRLPNGQGIGYGLGVSLGYRNGHRVVAHGGEIGGFVASNTVFPDDKIAVVVLTNQEASAAAGTIGRAVSALILPPPAVQITGGPSEGQVMAILAGLQHGQIDRNLLSPDANFYFSETAIRDFQTSLTPLGALKEVHAQGSGLRGGMTYRGFEAEFTDGTKVSVSTYTLPDGKIEQFLVDAE